MVQERLIDYDTAMYLSSIRASSLPNNEAARDSHPPFSELRTDAEPLCDIVGIETPDGQLLRNSVRDENLGPEFVGFGFYLAIPGSTAVRIKYGRRFMIEE